MKKTGIMIAVLWPCLAIMAQDQAFVVKGKVAMYEADAKAYLNYMYKGDGVIDSVVIQDGSFSFSGKVAAPVAAKVFVGKNPYFKRTDVVSIYLESGTIQVNSSGAIHEAVVGGTALNNDRQRYQQMLLKTEAAIDSANTANSNFVAGLNTAKRADMRAFILQNNSSPISIDIIQEYAGIKPAADTLEYWFNQLSEGVKTTVKGVEFTRMLQAMKTTHIGAMAPAFTQEDTAGRKVSLESFRGKYVLIDFWASWCAPCRAENPNVVKAFNAYRDKKFTVLSVSLDKNRQAWVKAIQDDKLMWTHVSDLQFWNNAVAKAYNIKSVPASYLIDPQGKIVAKDLRGAALEEFLKTVLQ